jgi:hypothetical protein
MATWDLSLMPLVVLFSPTLRLRYRVSWFKATSEIPVLSKIFKTAVQSTRKQALAMEFDGKDAPAGTVFVCDCHSSTEVDGHMRFAYKDGKTVGATLFLPKVEDSPYDTNKITLHQMGHCLGLVDSDDKTSIMYAALHDRPTSFSLNDIELLTTLINL